MARRFRSLTFIVALAVPLLGGACVPDDSVTPRSPSTLEGALADVAHPALDWVAATFSGAGIITPTINPAACPLEAASQFFVCAPISGGGLTLKQRFILLDASGARQPAFDPGKTVALHLENSVSGTWLDRGASLTVDGQQTLDLTGLGSPKHTLNGVSLTLTSLFDPTLAGHPPVKSERKTTVSDLVIPVVASGAPTAWPVSGTIDLRTLNDYGEELPIGGTTTVSIASMRFDGSSLVTLTVTVPGGTQTCRLNIAIASGLGCSSQ